MSYIRWTFRIVLLALLVGVLHYNLPDRDIVRIVNTEVRRVDFGTNSFFWQTAGVGDAVNTQNRDVLFIEAIRPNGKSAVYRNEDTGWGWPPYFKFDTANLQAQARDMVSGENTTKWVAVRHYGWRNTFLSIFPNALSIKPVAGPDVRLIPWFNIIFCTLLAIILITIWRLWRNFWHRRVDPMIDSVEHGADTAKGWFRRK